jgi:hypothetical protein
MKRRRLLLENRNLFKINNYAKFLTLKSTITEIKDQIEILKSRIHMFSLICDIRSRVNTRGLDFDQMMRRQHTRDVLNAKELKQKL